jgi:uncharacterized membrane protein YcaP (DUF421 family)
MFFGDIPALFYLEIVARTVVMYLWALLMLRLIGKRGMRELSPFDYVIIIALGSSVGDPMFYPQVPLLHGMIVVAVVVALERGMAWAVQSNEDVERFVEGVPVRLVADGRLDLEGMRTETLAREELFAILRVNKASQLGEVKRVYLEQSGQVSVFLYDDEETRPGLPLIPPWDISSPPTYAVEEKVPAEGFYACLNCGETQRFWESEVFTYCPECENEEWTVATRQPIKDLAPDA